MCRATIVPDVLRDLDVRAPREVAMAVAVIAPRCIAHRLVNRVVYALHSLLEIAADVHLEILLCMHDRAPTGSKMYAIQE